MWVGVCVRAWMRWCAGAAPVSLQPAAVGGGGGGGETKESNADDGVAVGLPADLPEEGPLPLGLFKNQATLAGVGMDRLKTALLAVGFKCGGSLEQRAERLWDAKEAMDGGKALDKYSFAKVH